MLPLVDLRAEPRGLDLREISDAYELEATIRRVRLRGDHHPPAEEAPVRDSHVEGSPFVPLLSVDLHSDADVLVAGHRAQGRDEERHLSPHPFGTSVHDGVDLPADPEARDVDERA